MNKAWLFFGFLIDFENLWKPTCMPTYCLKRKPETNKQTNPKPVGLVETENMAQMVLIAIVHITPRRMTGLQTFQLLNQLRDYSDHCH